MTINPGIGKFGIFPGLTLSGPCDIITVESDAGGPIDRWAEIKTPEEHLAFTQHCLNTHFPWEAARLGELELVDRMGVAQAHFTPEVRRAVGTLPSGAKVLGLGDVMTLCDPMGGQGSNLATIHASVLREAIRERRDKPFDEDFIVESFERHWKDAQWGVKYSNALAGPPTPAGGLLFDAASKDPEICRFIANSLDAPVTLAPYFADTDSMVNFLVSRGYTPPSPPP